LIYVTTTEVVSIGIGAEVLGEAELSTQTNTYRRPFSTVIDGITVHIVMVVRVVVDVSQFEVRSQSLVFAVGEGITCIYTQFITHAVVRLTVNFHVVAQLVVITRLEQTRNAAVRSHITSITQFEVVTGFQAEAPSVGVGATVNVSTVAHGCRQVVVEVRVAQATINKDVVREVSRRVDVGSLAVLIYLTRTVIHVTFSEACSRTDDPLSVVTVNFGINTDHDAVNILIIVDGAVVAVEVTTEVAYPCAAVISQAMTRVGQTSTNGVLFQVPDIGVRRRDAQRHVSVVGQLHLLQNNGVTALFSLIGVCTQVSFVSSREGRVAVFVVDVDQIGRA